MSLEEIFAKLKSSKKKEPSHPEWIIAGLGNPGEQYSHTRHNVGFRCVEKLAREEEFEIKKVKFKSLISDTVIQDKRCIIMKPSTFMNNSGEAVRECADFYKIPPENILVIYDDISLDIGKLRIRRKGSDGGHNGIKSIIYQLNSNEFPRIKIGVGAKPSPDYNLADWVLSSFSAQDDRKLESALSESVDAVKLILSGKTNEAMNRHNS